MERIEVSDLQGKGKLGEGMWLGVTWRLLRVHSRGGRWGESEKMGGAQSWRQKAQPPPSSGIGGQGACWGLPWGLRWSGIRLQCRRPGFHPRLGKIP